MRDVRAAAICFSVRSSRSLSVICARLWVALYVAYDNRALSPRVSCKKANRGNVRNRVHECAANEKNSGWYRSKTRPLFLCVVGVDKIRRGQAIGMFRANVNG